MDDLSFKMRYRRELLLLIPAISAIFFITDYSVFFASSAQAQRQSQSATSVCNGNGGSCFTTLCSNDQPCQTFSSNQPSFVQPSQEVTTTMRPVEEIPIMQSAEEATVMQPADEVTEQHIEVSVEFCDDGLDNDDDGKVDEECGAATFSSAPPVQGQLMSDDLTEGEDYKQQLSNGELEQPSREDGHSDDESNEVREEKEDGGDEENRADKEGDSGGDDN
jgi:hypothetical protein